MLAEHREQLDRFYQLPGFCSTSKADHLFELVLSEKPRNICEVGVYGGRSLMPMAYGCVVNGFGTVYGVDSWSSDAATEGEPDSYTEVWKTHDFESIYNTCKAATLEPPYNRVIFLYRGHLLNLCDSFGDGSMDIIHEDGNHSPTIVEQSVRKWAKKLRVGGLFIWDDPGWAGNQRAIDLVHHGLGLKLLEDRNAYHVLRKVVEP